MKYSIIDFVDLIKNQFPELNVFPLSIPINSPDNSVSIVLSATKASFAGNYPLNVQIKVRDTHPSLAEKTSLEIREFLEKKTDYHIGKVQIVLSEAVNPYPLYMGEDTEGNHLYSNNFRFIVNEGVK